MSTVMVCGNVVAIGADSSTEDPKPRKKKKRD
jgi:hypothetical protein